MRGVVYDKDFDVPLPAADVLLVERNERVMTTDQGNYVFPDVPPGKYTLVFSKEGYVRQVRGDVVVSPGRLTDADAWLSGEFTELEEFVVQDILSLGGGSEAALLELRLESPSLMDSVGSDLMSKAGASDAASALKLVSGATVQDGKFAVIRGLPDRYVSSQMNGVRLPTADEDKRAVELDQFPAAVIESIQVTKTFTPDQQGDASGGAVDVRLKGIPDETVAELKSQVSFNTQVAGRTDFLTYEGGGVGTWGIDDGGRDVQLDALGGNWDGAVGVSEGNAPIDHKWSASVGGKHELDDGVRIGGFANFFYERDSSFFDNGVNDSLWIENPGGPLVPEKKQQTASNEFITALFDVTQAKQSVQWGGLGTLGLETEHHKLGLTYLYSRTTEDKATLAIDTRGKESIFPGYDPNDPMGIGNGPDDLGAAPYVRTETLDYTERTTSTLQLHGEHALELDTLDIGPFSFGGPELDWTLARSSAGLDEPDKRQFGALWVPASYNPGFPPFLPPFTTPNTWFPFKPAANFTLGNLQRIWKTIDEDSKQYSLDLEVPFEQWSELDGYLKFGAFDDSVDRRFDQDTFSNFNDFSSYEAPFDDPWSDVFSNEDHPITEGKVDIDYDGKLGISAWYGMIDLPVHPSVSLIGGARLESTDISIVNQAEEDAIWFPPDQISPFALTPGAADVSFQQDDILPSVGLIVRPHDKVTVRGSYSQTVGRQTFKELTPIIQQEFLGGPIFIGNPDLRMSSLENFDLRFDYAPYDGGLVSLSWFKKNVEDPIEYVQRLVGFSFTTPRNYPKGTLDGWEVEVRQSLGRFSEGLEGLAIGGNATFIQSEVRLPDDEISGFQLPNIMVPIKSRDMTNAPEHLYNLYLTYDIERIGTQLALFYTVKGDTLVAGAAEQSGNFVPSIYEKEFGTLNLSISKRIGDHSKIQFQAKNLTNPVIESVYRTDVIDEDVTRTSYTRGREFSLGISLSF